MVIARGATVAASITLREPDLAPYLAGPSGLGVNVLTQGSRPDLSREAANYSFIHELERTFRDVRPQRSW
jgi:hypothetical protein